MCSEQCLEAPQVTMAYHTNACSNDLDDLGVPLFWENPIWSCIAGNRLYHPRGPWGDARFPKRLLHQDWNASNMREKGWLKLFQRMLILWCYLIDVLVGSDSNFPNACRSLSPAAPVDHPPPSRSQSQLRPQEIPQPTVSLIPQSYMEMDQYLYMFQIFNDNIWCLSIFRKKLHKRNQLKRMDINFPAVLLFTVASCWPPAKPHPRRPFAAAALSPTGAPTEPNCATTATKTALAKVVL